MFAGKIIVDYSNESIRVVTTPFRYRGLKFFFVFFLSLKFYYVVVCPALQEASKGLFSPTAFFDLMDKRNVLFTPYFAQIKKRFDFKKEDLLFHDLNTRSRADSLLLIFSLIYRSGISLDGRKGEGEKDEGGGRGGGIW